MYPANVVPFLLVLLNIQTAVVAAVTISIDAAIISKAAIIIFI
jgi:hypothetical protein